MKLNLKLVLLIMGMLLIAKVTCGQTSNEKDKTAIAYNSINHPENEEYIVEVAYNLDKAVKDITQQKFDQRYSTFTIILGGPNKRIYYIYSDDERPYGVWIDDYYHEEWDLDDMLSYLERL